MNNYKNFGMLASIVFAAGMVGLNLSDGTFDLDKADSTALTNTAGFLGHIEAIQTDSEGNIKAYQQTDNLITNKGVNCSFVLLFDATPSANTCQGAQTAGSWKVIALDSATQASGLDASANTTSSRIVANGLAPATGTTTITVPSITTGNIGTARITAVFTVSGTQTVNSASLLNSTSLDTAGLFAYKDFATPLSLVTGDSLTVNWDISLTGGGNEV